MWYTWTRQQMYGPLATTSTNVQHAVTEYGGWLGYVYWFLLIQPFQIVYLQSWWHGRPLEDICAALTKVEARFWTAHPWECEDVIRRDMQVYWIYILYFLYMTAMITAVKTVWSLVWRRCTLFTRGEKKN